VEADEVFTAANRVRKQTALLVTVVVAPLLFYLLMANGATAWGALGICTILVLTVFPTLSYGLSVVELQLQRRFKVIGVSDSAANGVRLVFTSICAVLNLAIAPLLVVGALVLAVTQSALASRAAKESVDITRRAPRSDLVTDFRRAFYQMAPATIAIVGAEQAITIMLTLANNTAGIAQIAALSRFAVGFALLNSVVGTIGAGYLARIQPDRRAIVTGALRYNLLYFAASTIFAGAVVACSPLLLPLLGEPYENLRIEFLVIMLGSLTTNIALYGVGAVNHARGWLAYGWTYIPLVLLWACVCLFVLDVSTSMGAAILSASLSLPLLVSNLIRAGAGIAYMPKSDPF